MRRVEVGGDFSEDISEWNDVDDEEIHSVLLTPDEIAEKTKLWTEHNREYLADQLLKKGLGKPIEELAGEKVILPLILLTLSFFIVQKKRKIAKIHTAPTQSMSEAAIQALTGNRPKLSRKINRDAIEKLLSPPSSSSVPTADAVPIPISTNMTNIGSTKLAVDEGGGGEEEDDYYNEEEGGDDGHFGDYDEYNEFY